jgi:NADH:ubiquinone oxidoreductase subunit 4 (subunit M)
MLGFWAELEMLAGIVKLFLYDGVASLAAAATLSVSTVLSAAYGLLCFKKVFFGPPRARLEEKLSEPVVVAFALSLASIALGSYPALPLAALAQLP